LEKVSGLGGELKSIVKSLEINHNIRIPEGQRHITLISLADSLLFNHLAKGKDILATLRILCRKENLSQLEKGMDWVQISKTRR
jgi:hypothetical protein